MAVVSRDLQDTLAQAWALLAGGDLWVVEGAPDSVALLLPERVRQAIEQGRGLVGEPIGQAVWWVSSPIAAAGQLQLVGSSTCQGRWDVLLETWAALLAQLYAERETSQDLTDQLIHAWDRLAFLYQLARIASGASALPDMLSAIVRLVAQVLAPEEAFLVQEVDGRVDAVTASGASLEQAEALLACVKDSLRPLTLDEVRPMLTAWPLSGDLLLAPWKAGSRRGLVGLRGKEATRFDANDLQLLASVAEQVGALVESAEARAAQLERERLEHELLLASEFQRTLLPPALPRPPGLRLAAHLRPARRVGGDLYDALTHPSGELVLLLADVAGKGMPAALLTALVHAVFRGEAVHPRDPGDLLGAMNRSLFPDLDRTDTFVTAVVLRLMKAGERSVYASAGHLELILHRAQSGSMEYLPATGPPLGVEGEARYASRSLSLEPFDTLVIYSDGVTEAEGAGARLFGRQGLEDAILASLGAPPEAQLQVVLQALDAHRDELPLRDDVALVLVRAEPAEAAAEDEDIPFVIPARISAVTKRMAELREAIGSRVAPERQRSAQDFCLAVSEIVTNQVQHACAGLHSLVYGRVRISRTGLQADLFDRGIEFRPSPVPDGPLDLLDPPDRGYGLRLARGLTDGCEYQRLGDGRNHWRLWKRLTREESL